LRAVRKIKTDEQEGMGKESGGRDGEEKSQRENSSRCFGKNENNYGKLWRVYLELVGDVNSEGRMFKLDNRPN